MSTTNIFALNVGQWCSFAQKRGTTMCCTFSHLYVCFAWEVWVWLCFCVLTAHAVFFIGIARWLFFCSAGDQHFLKNVCQRRTFLGKMSVNVQHSFKNVCQWPRFHEKCLAMTDISWRMSVNHQHFGSIRWLMTFIFPCTLTHLYECVSLKVCVCYSLFGVTRRSISARLFSLPQLTNNSWKMSVNDQGFCSKCWWMMFICPEMKDKHVLHFFSPLCKFYLGSVGLSLPVGHHQACCVLYQHNPRAVFWFPGRPTFLEKCLSMTNIFALNVCQGCSFAQNMKDNRVLDFFVPLCMFCLGSVGLSLLVLLTGHAVFFIDITRWLFLVPRETNIPWKMSVNDQHFSENVCQWPTFL